MCDNMVQIHTKYYKTLSDVSKWRFIRDVEHLIKDSEWILRSKGIPTRNIIRNMALGSVAYLIAGRISEVVSLKLKDIKIYENRLHEKFMSFDMVNKKNQKQTFKRVVANFKNEKYFIDIVYRLYKERVRDSFLDLNAKNIIYGKYEDGEDIQKVLDSPLFVPQKDSNKSVSTEWGRQICHKSFGINSHTFRKIRLTHLYMIYNMSSKEVQHFAGHSNILSSEPYINITGKDFEAKMSFIAR